LVIGEPPPEKLGMLGITEQPPRRTARPAIITKPRRIRSSPLYRRRWRVVGARR
jgi:hypothetical protein